MAEIISCPSCQRKLQIPEEYFGKTVQCPECKHAFPANPASSSVTAPPPPAPREEKTPEWERRPTPRDEDDDRPRRRLRDEDAEDDEFEEVHRRRRRQLTPHRGGMILTLGILATVFCGFGLILGPMAWVMGNNDLNEIRGARMDPDGEGMTNAGRILGIVGTLLNVAVVLFYCVIFAIALGAGGGRF